MKLYFIILIIIIILILFLLTRNQVEGFRYNPPKVTEISLRPDNTCSDPNQIFKVDRFDYYAYAADLNGLCPPNYERYNYSYRNAPEVFFVNSNVTQANANNVCTNFGAVQSTYHQLLNAFDNAMNVCIDGWVSDKTNFSFFPINNSADFGTGVMQPDCKGNSGMIVGGPIMVRNAQVYSNVRTTTDTAGVYCYGQKPNLVGSITTLNNTSKDANNIAYFNTTKQSMNDNIYCLPSCDLLGSNANVKFTQSPNDPTICLTSNCANTPQLSNTIQNSWNAICAILNKTNNSFNKTLSNINTVNSNIDNQYNIINTYYDTLNTTVNGWSSSAPSQYTLALPYLSNLSNDHSALSNIHINSSNNYNTLLSQKHIFDNIYTGFACSNYL